MCTDSNDSVGGQPNLSTLAGAGSAACEGAAAVSAAAGAEMSLGPARCRLARAANVSAPATARCIRRGTPCMERQNIIFRLIPKGAN